MRHPPNRAEPISRMTTPLPSRLSFVGLALFAIASCAGCKHGKNYDLMFPGPHPDWSPHLVLPCVDRCLIRGAIGVDLILSERDPGTSRYIGLLRKSGGYHRGRPSGYPDMVIDVGSSKTIRMWREESPSFQYVSATGELGRGDEWCQVPDEFRRWVRSMQTKFPADHSPLRNINGTIVRSSGLEHRAPRGSVKAYGHREHVFQVLSYTPPLDTSIWPLPWGSQGCEVQFAVGPPPATTSSHWQVLSVIQGSHMQMWQPSYAGKTIYYRIRWKFVDGQYGPWSKVVSAKVLP